MCDNCLHNAMRLAALAFNNLGTLMTLNQHNSPDMALCARIGQVMEKSAPPDANFVGDRRAWALKARDETRAYLAPVPSRDLATLGKTLDALGSMSTVCSQLVGAMLRERADRGDAVAEEEVGKSPDDEQGPAIEVHVIDLDAMFRARQTTNNPTHPH